MTSKGGVKSAETVCVKDNLSSIVDKKKVHVFSNAVGYAEITFPPVVETEAVHQQPVIQTAHLQPCAHTHTLSLNLCNTALYSCLYLI